MRPGARASYTKAAEELTTMKDDLEGRIEELESKISDLETDNHDLLETEVQKRVLQYRSVKINLSI